jgi:hypothetical protein
MPTYTGLQTGDTSSNLSQAFASKNVLGSNGSTLNVASYTVNDGYGGNNYTVTLNTAQGTITPAMLTVTALGNTKTYDGTTSAVAMPVVSGLQGSDDTVTGLSETYATPGVGTGKTLNVASYLVNDGNGGNNYTIQTVASVAGVINPATLTYIADPASRVSGMPNPIFTGTVTGFVSGETLATATTGALVFTSPASPSSPPGSYAIDGSGLSAVNYIFVQGAGNATALTINQGTNNPTSQFNPSPGTNPTTQDVNFTFQNNTPGPITISFTPPVHVASNPPADKGNDVTPAALPDGRALATNNGFVYLPISQFDANQYSQFKLPDYAAQAGEAAVFTMIARGADAQHAADDLIDTFWNGTSGAWASANAALMTKVMFSDGAGNTITPTGHPGFPIVAGKTDLASLLKTGPVMIGDGGNPVHWMLATQMTADGKGIVSNDPATGKQVVLGYDPVTKNVGGVTGVFDSDKKTFVSLANALANLSADTHLSTLQSFVPAEFLAVTVK